MAYLLSSVPITLCMLQRKVGDWKKTDVSKWLATLGMSKYEECFKTMSGKARMTVPVPAVSVINKCAHLGGDLQRLLQLSAADVYRFAENKHDADRLLESIQSLRDTGVCS